MLEKFQNSTDYTKKDIRYLLVLFQETFALKAIVVIWFPQHVSHATTLMFYWMWKKEHFQKGNDHHRFWFSSFIMWRAFISALLHEIYVQTQTYLICKYPFFKLKTVCFNTRNEEIGGPFLHIQVIMKVRFCCLITIFYATFQWICSIWDDESALMLPWTSQLLFVPWKTRFRSMWEDC